MAFVPWGDKSTTITAFSHRPTEECEDVQIKPKPDMSMPVILEVINSPVAVHEIQQMAQAFEVQCCV